MNETMGIRALGARVGVTPHTLRYYETAGQMIPVPRDDAGRRRYSEDHVRWIAFLLRLRSGGMGIAQVRRYVELTQSKTDASREERLELLRRHRDVVSERIDELRRHLDVLDRKVARGCTPRPHQEEDV